METSNNETLRDNTCSSPPRITESSAFTKFLQQKADGNIAAAAAAGLKLSSLLDTTQLESGK